MTTFWWRRGVRYSWTKVVVLLLLSHSLSVALFFLIRYGERGWERRSSAQVETLAHKATSFPFLSTSLLAELLDLSVDHPVGLDSLASHELEARLLALPLFKAVKIRKQRPHTLYVEYTLRRPLALLGDCANTAIDEEGVFFPYLPFYTPLHLPEVYLAGISHPLCGASESPLPSTEGRFSQRECEKQGLGVSSPWGEKMEPSLCENMKALLHAFPPGAVTKIDLSASCASSLGNRELVVELEGGVWLRLPSSGYEEALERYRLASTHLSSEGCRREASGQIWVDLRIPQVAYWYNRIPI